MGKSGGRHCKAKTRWLDSQRHEKCDYTSDLSAQAQLDRTNPQDDPALLDAPESDHGFLAVLLAILISSQDVLEEVLDIIDAEGRVKTECQLAEGVMEVEAQQQADIVYFVAAPPVRNGLVDIDEAIDTHAGFGIDEVDLEGYL